MKQALILDETVVKKTIEDAMVSDKGQQFWEKLFKRSRVLIEVR